MLKLLARDDKKYNCSILFASLPKLISPLSLPCFSISFMSHPSRAMGKQHIRRHPLYIDWDDNTGKKLERGISRATENVNLVSRARQEFEMDLHTQCHEQNEKNLNFIDTPDYTFTLPDLTKYTEEFR